MILLPYPPSANRYWRVFRGRAVHSAEAREYKDEVERLAREQRVIPMATCVKVRITLMPVQPKDHIKRAKADPKWGLSVRRIDIDNAGKVALDALQGIIYFNDRQITDYRVRLGAPMPGGGLLVEWSVDEEWESPR